MADKERPRWSDRALRYLWRPRHGREGDPRTAGWTAILVAAAVIIGIGTAAYSGFRDGDDEAPEAAPAALPTFSLTVPGGFPSPAVSVAPAPSPSATSTSTPTAVPTSATAPARATRTPAATSRPPAARKKPPVFQEKVIASTSVLTTGQSWSTDRLSLTVTAGGNLVLQDQGRTVWQTGTTTGVKLVMQNDGHLVLYDAGNGTAFSSGTAGNPGAVLILRADGNMVISLNGRILFQTGTGD